VVRLNWKVARLALCGGLLLLGAGCSGINASKSISPATFLLPGLLQADPSPAHPDLTLPLAEPPAEAVTS
jgi:hypothetical protein